MTEQTQDGDRARPGPSPTDGETIDAAESDEELPGGAPELPAERGPDPGGTHPDARDPSVENPAKAAPGQDVDEFGTEQGGYGVTVAPD